MRMSKATGPNDQAMAYAKGLRELADFAERLAEDDVPWGHTVYISVASVAEMVEKARNLGGTWEKRPDEYAYSLVRKFGRHSVRIEVPRESSCVRVQTGTRKVNRPDPNAPMVEIEEPVYEWLCPDSIIKGATGS